MIHSLSDDEEVVEEKSLAKHQKEQDDKLKKKEFNHKKKMKKIEEEEITEAQNRELTDKANNDIDLQPDIEEKGKFRMLGNAFMITYKTHVDKKFLTKFFKDKFIASRAKEPNDIARIEIAHESPEKEGRLDSFGVPIPAKTPYNHTHCVITFIRQVDWSGARSCDIEAPDDDGKIITIHPHIKKIFTGRGGNDSEQYINAIRYLGKEDPDNKHLLDFNKNLILTIWGKQTMKDALKLAQKPSDIQGIKTAYEMKPKSDHCDLDIIELGGTKYAANEMQLKVIEKIKGGQDNRVLTWIVDKKGGAGKSTLCKELALTGLAHVIVNNGGGTRDVGTNLEFALKSGWDGKCVLFDFARTIGRYERDGIYTMLETIKNGQISVSKYGSNTLMLPRSPVVIVFANFRPKIWASRSKDIKGKSKTSCQSTSSPSTVEHLKKIVEVKRREPTLTLSRWDIIVVGKFGVINQRSTDLKAKQLAKAIEDYEKYVDQEDADSDLNAFSDDSD